MNIVNVLDLLRRRNLTNMNNGKCMILTEDEAAEIIVALEDNSTDELRTTNIVLSEIVSVTPENVDDINGNMIVECSTNNNESIRLIIPNGCKNTYLLVDAIRE